MYRENLVCTVNSTVVCTKAIQIIIIVNIHQQKLKWYFLAKKQRRVLSTGFQSIYRFGTVPPKHCPKKLQVLSDVECIPLFSSLYLSLLIFFSLLFLFLLSLLSLSLTRFLFLYLCPSSYLSLQRFFSLSVCRKISNLALSIFTENQKP